MSPSATVWSTAHFWTKLELILFFSLDFLSNKTKRIFILYKAPSSIYPHMYFTLLSTKSWQIFLTSCRWSEGRSGQCWPQSWGPHKSRWGLLPAGNRLLDPVPPSHTWWLWRREEEKKIRIGAQSLKQLKTKTKNLCRAAELVIFLCDHVTDSFHSKLISKILNKCSLTSSEKSKISQKSTRGEQRETLAW